MTVSAYYSLGAFLLHALTLEEEAVECLLEVADMMEVHNNTELQQLFESLASFGVKHAAEIQTLCEGHELPALKPWEFEWPDGESPEQADTGNLHYLMSPRQALELALNSESRAQAYYQDIAENADSESIRTLAAEFAEEEAEHVKLLRNELAKCHEVGRDQAQDLDPPNMPE